MSPRADNATGTTTVGHWILPSKPDIRNGLKLRCIPTGLTFLTVSHDDAASWTILYHDESKWRGRADCRHTTSGENGADHRRRCADGNCQRMSNFMATEET